MTRHEIRDYIGVLIIVALVFFGMLYIQKHIDSMASTIHQQHITKGK
jgi:hypothetical protein